VYFYTIYVFLCFEYSVIPGKIFYGFNLGGFYTVILCLDPMSLVFILLTSFLFPICFILHNYCSVQFFFLKFKQYYVRVLGVENQFLSNKIVSTMNLNIFYISLLLILELILFYFFVSTDLFVFYVLFECSVIPVYFMVGRFGSRLNRIKAANYLLVFTIFGSIFFLSGVIFILYVYGSVSIYVVNELDLPEFVRKIL